VTFDKTLNHPHCSRHPFLSRRNPGSPQRYGIDSFFNDFLFFRCLLGFFLLLFLLGFFRRYFFLFLALCDRALFFLGFPGFLFPFLFFG